MTPTGTSVRPGLRRVAIVIFVLLTPVAAHALWDYLEARRLSRVIEDIRRKGEPVHFARLGEGRPITPEQKQASHYYAAAAILTRDAYRDHIRSAVAIVESIATLSPEAAKRDPRLDETKQIVASYAPALDLLDRASALDARGLDFGDELRYGFPQKYLTDVNALRISRLAFLGEAEAASSALIGTLRTGRVYSDLYLLNWPIYTDRSLRLILVFAPPAEPMLRQLQEEHAKWDLDDEVERRLLAIRGRLVQAVWPGATGELPTLPRVRDPGNQGRGPSLIDLALRPLFTNRITRWLSGYDEALIAARQPWPAKLDAAQALAEKYPSQGAEPTWERWIRRYDDTSLFWLRQNASASELGRIAPAIAVQIARRRVAVATLAIERYRRGHAGALPAALTDLTPAYLAALPIDPFSGQALRYVSGPDRYKVYSVGTNRTDDGGDWSVVDRDRPRSRLIGPTSKDLGLEIPRGPRPTRPR